MVTIRGVESSTRRRQDAAESGERIVDGGWFVAAMHHAVRATRVAGLGAVLAPCGSFHQFSETFGVSILQKIARLLPAEDVVRRHSPGGARIVPLAHQELEE